MLDNKIGYIICETGINESLKKEKPVVVDSSKNRVVIEAIIQDADKKNRNGRYYAKEDLFPALGSARIKELLSHSALMGENGHPVENNSILRQSTIDPNNICCNYIKIWTEGNLVKAHVKGTPNQKGEDFNNLILDGTDPAFSLRALGSITNTKRGAEVKNINIVTWDHVFYPSHSAAYGTGIVNESGIMLPNHIKSLQESTSNKVILDENDKGILLPITNQSVMSYIKNESANINTILKSFDTLYESATIVDNGSKVRLMTNTGDILMINLESYIQNEIMDYCYR